MALRTPWLHKALRPAWRRLNQVLGVETYWSSRKHLRYYQEAVRLARRHVPSGRSVLDVGSATTEVLLALDTFTERVALDANPMHPQSGIERVVTDFMRYAPPIRFDLVLCLQVLEHVQDPTAFARKLLATGETIVVSVPYKWPPGRAHGHRHDPIDEATLDGWFGRQPVERSIVRERSDRLIAVYR